MCDVEEKYHEMWEEALETGTKDSLLAYKSPKAAREAKAYEPTGGVKLVVQQSQKNNVDVFLMVNTDFLDDFTVRAAVQVHALSASVTAIFVYCRCAVCTGATATPMLTSAHDMVTIIADHKTAENIIILFPVLDVDFKKSLNILKEFTVGDCRTVFFIIPKHSDVFCVCEHILETGSRPHKPEL